MPKTKSTNENCYVALLRGINVGGNNLIKMADLRTNFGQIGFTRVETYIQSGNVVFCAKKMGKAKLTEMIEQALSDAFSYQSRVVIVSAAELQQVVAQAPKGFGQEPDIYRYDVLFVREPFKTQTHRGGRPEPAAQIYPATCLQAHHRPQLAHHDEAARNGHVSVNPSCFQWHA
jgi:hypothetical protein